MKYLIKKYNEGENYFECQKDGSTMIHRIDLFVDGTATGFGRTRGLTMEKWLEKMHSFEGKWVEIDRTWAFMELAGGVKLLNN